MKVKIFIILVITFLFQSCTTTKLISTDEQLIDNAGGTIRIFTKDSLLYTLSNFILKDSLISGNGLVSGNNSLDVFRGDLKISNIIYIQSSHFDFFKSLFVGAACGFIGYKVIDSFRGDRLVTHENVRYSAPSSGYGTQSCPFIYSWEGSKYILEGETFGISLSKSLEMKTSHVLKSLNSTPTAKIKLTNERPETHYFNHIQIKAVEVNKNAEVYSDANNRFWEVKSKTSPLSAIDHSGNNILGTVNKPDNNYWKSDLVNANTSKGFEDMIELQFIPDKTSDTSLLVINAINTDLSLAFFQFLGGYLGDQLLEFYNTLETDPEMISIFKNWVQETSLKSYIWNGKYWQECGFIFPEANAVPFSKVIAINCLDIEQDTIKILLKSLSDVWKIDDVNLASGSELKTIDVPLVSALDNHNLDIREIINTADDQYKVLFPSDSIVLNFNPLTSGNSNKIVYTLNAQGYLYEWMTEENYLTASQKSSISRAEKINFLKNILKYKSVFLPPIYAAWRNSDHR